MYKKIHIRYCSSFINAALHLWTHRFTRTVCVCVCVRMLMCRRCMCTLVCLVDESRRLPWLPMGRLTTQKVMYDFFHVLWGAQKQYHHTLVSVYHQLILLILDFNRILEWMWNFKWLLASSWLYIGKLYTCLWDRGQGLVFTLRSLLQKPRVLSYSCRKSSILSL